MAKHMYMHTHANTHKQRMLIHTYTQVYTPYMATTYNTHMHTMYPHMYIFIHRCIDMCAYIHTHAYIFIDRCVGHSKTQLSD